MPTRGTMVPGRLPNYYTVTLESGKVFEEAAYLGGFASPREMADYIDGTEDGQAVASKGVVYCFVYGDDMSEFYFLKTDGHYHEEFSAVVTLLS